MPQLDKNTTAEEALRGHSLKGRRAIVTGAASGIGTETARVLALAGADVVLAVRNVEAGEKVAAELRSALPASAGALTVKALDLADFGSVRAFAKDVVDEGKPLHLLVNNAGVMACPLGETKQGFETQMGTNHLGHFLLTQLLRPRLEATDKARIITVSSDLHKRGRGERVLQTLEDDPRFQKRKYEPFGAYGDSKLANILFTKALAKRLPPNVFAYSLHPGVIQTNLSRHVGGVGGAVFKAVGGLFMKSIPQGAATSVYAATAPELSKESGQYLADCKLKRPSDDALDAKLAERVWQVSEKLTGTAA